MVQGRAVAPAAGGCGRPCCQQQRILGKSKKFRAVCCKRAERCQSAGAGSKYDVTFGVWLGSHLGRLFDSDAGTYTVVAALGVAGMLLILGRADSRSHATRAVQWLDVNGSV